MKEKFLISNNNKYTLVNTKEINFIKSEGNYSTINFIDKRKPLLICKTLKDVEESLSEFQFCRCHQSFLVNLYEIKEIYNDKMKTIKLKNEEKINLSVRGKHKLMSLIKKL